MLEPETVRALIEAKEHLQNGADFIIDAERVASADVIVKSDMANARAHVVHAVALIASILDQGR